MCNVEDIKVKRLSSGWVLVSGRGPCNWAQAPYLPTALEELEKYAFPEASRAFLSAAYRFLNQDTRGKS